MSTGELCNQKQVILGKEVSCRGWKDHTGKHFLHSDIKDQYGNELGADISWPNFIGKDIIKPN